MKKNTKQIIINSLKIIMASVVSIIIASLLNLQFAVSAGIVAILSVQPSKRETVLTALSRLYGFITSLAIGIFCYNIFGFTISSFCIYLAIYIFICQIFKWYSSMAMNSVLISHFITFQNTCWQSVLNEVLIFIIGVGLGIIVNLHLHKNTAEAERIKSQMDDKIVLTLHRMSLRILDKNLKDYDGRCFCILENLLEEGKIITDENYKNQLNNRRDFDEEYIMMREQQIHILYEMYKRCRSINIAPFTAKAISDFLEKISKEYERENDCISLLEEFTKIREDMKNQPLPLSREEFENRAELYTLLEYIEDFLVVKKNFTKAS